MNSHTNETEAADLGDGLVVPLLEQSQVSSLPPPLAVSAIPTANSNDPVNHLAALPGNGPRVVLPPIPNRTPLITVNLLNPQPVNHANDPTRFTYAPNNARAQAQRAVLNDLELDRTNILPHDARHEFLDGADIMLISPAPIDHLQGGQFLGLEEAQTLLQQILSEVQGVATTTASSSRATGAQVVPSPNLGASNSALPSLGHSNSPAQVTDGGRPGGQMGQNPLNTANQTGTRLMMHGMQTTINVAVGQVPGRDHVSLSSRTSSSSSDNSTASRFVVPVTGQKLWIHDLINFMAANIATVKDEGAANNLKSLLTNLDGKSATVLLYVLDPTSDGSNVWPDIRDRTKSLVQVTPIQCPNYAFRSVPTRILPAPRHDQRLAELQEHAKNALRRQEILDLVERSTSGNPTWPQKSHTLPLEVYQLILQHLSRDDVKALRMTCKEIEFRISHVLFETVVVPFNTEIYGMLLSEAIAQHDTGGKENEAMIEKMIEYSQLSTTGGLVWKNLGHPSDYIGHGVDVFKGFGPFIKRYGMSFEVDEDLLSSLPPKGMLQAHFSYWGSYDWPFPDYQRFSDIAKLENAADETPKMKLAFSFLQQVKELALSMDNGLGWIHGPDKSLHSRIFKQAKPVFGSGYKIPERRVQAQESLWRMLKKCATSSSDMEAIALGEVRHGLFTLPREAFDHIAQNNVSVGMSDLEIPRIELRSLLDSEIGERKFQGILDKLHDYPSISLGNHGRTGDCVAGILAYSTEQTVDDQHAVNPPLVPNRLTDSQKEWLLETEWAQGAFISSYMLSVVDNAASFVGVHTLNLSRISSRHLVLMDRHDFWNGLPQLENVTILAIAEWLTVWKGPAGIVECEAVRPLEASERFEVILTTAIAPRANIKTLNIGWATGGEHETGMFGRNQQLMPAPVLPYDWLLKGLREDRLLDEMIYFPYVQNLTLTNAWAPPAALCLFVKNHVDANLGKLTLDSISLTTQFSALSRYFKGGEKAIVVDLSSDNEDRAQPYQPTPLPYDTVQRLVHLVNPLNERERVNPQPPSGPMAQAGQVGQPQPMPIHPNATIGAALAAGFVPLNVNLLGNAPGVLSRPPPSATSSVLPGTDIQINDSWKGPHRKGSWPWILDRISPGATLASFEGAHSYKNYIKRRSKFKTLELRSCGYARINLPGLNQDAVEPLLTPLTRPGTLRKTSLISKMMLSEGDKDHMMGTISQNLHSWEANALIIVWGCTLGWEDEEAAEAATYDGFFKGGANRISTVLRRD